MSVAQGSELAGRSLTSRMGQPPSGLGPSAIFARPMQAALLDTAQGLDKEATWAKLAHDDMQALLDRSTWHDEGAQKTI